MIKKLLALLLLLVAPIVAYAQYVEEEIPLPDNTGALGTGDNAADISMSGGSQEEVMGTKEGEITLRTIEAGIEVFTGFNKVEMIPRESDGWVGSFTFDMSSIKFRPAGRPELDCPAQELAHWFGPCKIPDPSL